MRSRTSEPEAENFCIDCGSPTPYAHCDTCAIKGGHMEGELPRVRVPRSEREMSDAEFSRRISTAKRGFEAEAANDPPVRNLDAAQIEAEMRARGDQRLLQPLTRQELRKLKEARRKRRKR